MSLVASLNVGVSALRSFSEGIQVISNNISNVSTVGYKSSHANYADTFNNLLKPLVPNEKGVGAKIDPTQIGGGVQVESVTASFTQGSVTATGTTSDLAIAGPGYFRVKDPVSGNSFVTRAGNFRFDANGYLVTQQGYRVQGTNGATTKVAYDPSNGSYDVKTANNNPVVTTATVSPNSDTLLNVDTTGLTVGMVLYSAYSSVAPFKGVTATKNSDKVTVPSDVYSKLAVGQAFTGPGIPAGSYVLSKQVDDGSGNGTFLSNTIQLGPLTTDSNGNTSGPLVTADSDPINGLYSSAIWNNDPSSSDYPSSSTPVFNNHATIKSISGNTVVLDNPSILNAPTASKQMTLTFVAPKEVKLAAKNLSVYKESPSVLGISGGLSGMSVSSSTATLSAADAAKLKAGMTIFSAAFPSGTRVVSVVGTTVTFASKPVSTFTGTTDTITSLSNRIYSVDLQNASAVVDGMVAKLRDPASQQVTYAGVSVDRSSASPRVLLDFAAFGDGSVSGNNADPILDDYPSSTSSNPLFDITFETHTNAQPYSSATNIGDVRITFGESTDYQYTDINGGTLSSEWTNVARQNAPKIKNFTVGTDGSIMANLSNGQTFTTGKVLLQDFMDPGALVREGDNLFSGMSLAGEKNSVKWESLSASSVNEVTAGHSGLGLIQGSALEMSNVDIGQEFANMITTQRSFQAGSRVITVADQMLEETVNLKR